MTAQQGTLSQMPGFESFPKLLEQNYDCLTQETGQECTELFMDFIQNFESVLDQDVVRVKQITKIGSHVLKSEPELFDSSLKERLLQYNHDGVRITEDILEKSSDEKSRYRFMKMISHFLSHAGDIANELFDETRENKFAKTWYHDCLDSARTSISNEFEPPIDPTHAAHNFSLAAKAAFELSRLAKNDRDEIYWLERSYFGDTDSAEIRLDFGLENAALSYEFAGKSAFKLSDLYEKKQQQMRWMKNSYYSFKKAAKLLFEQDKENSARLFESAAERAADMYWLTRDNKWAKGAYRYFRKSAEMVAEMDEKAYTDRRYFAGNWAAALFVLSPDKSGLYLANYAKGAYRNYLHYYAIHNDTQRPVVIKQVKKDLSEILSRIDAFKLSSSRRRHNNTSFS